MKSWAKVGSNERLYWAGGGLLLAGVLPLLNLLPSNFPVYLTDYHLNLIGKYLCLALLALGLNLLWGFGGILSLGQAVFFGLGGYCMGMYLMLEIGAEQSKYGEAIPDFMVWNQVTALPFFWKPFQSFGLTLAAVILVPALFAAVFGYLTFRSRIRGVYIAILTQALAYAAWLLFNRNEMNLGGTNGLTDFKTLLGFPLRDPATQRALYIAAALFLILALAVCRGIVCSPLGRVLRAVRDNENRLRFCGYSTTGYKVFVFTVAAALAGLSGALYVPQVGIITPSQIGVLPSLEVVVWVALGGREHLLGGPLGALAVNGFRSYFTTLAPELWPFMLGGLFVVGVLFFPDGMTGLAKTIKRSLSRSVSSPDSSPRGGAIDGRLDSTPDSSITRGRPAADSGQGNGAVPGEGGSAGVRETLLYLEGVTVSFDGFLALRNLNFMMERGELRFVIGPNGAGKTTLLDVITGRVKPAAGRVLFGETDLLPLREHRIVEMGIGRKFQTPAIFPHHTVFDHLALALKGPKDIWASLAGRGAVSDTGKIYSILEFIGLDSVADRRAGSLPHGQKQWLEIGMLMAQDPKLLLIDEPVAGMTGKEREQTGLLLEAVTRTHSVLVIEHDMEFVRQFARQVTVLHEGSVLSEGPMEQVQKDPRVIEVYLGREQDAHA